MGYIKKSFGFYNESKLATYRNYEWHCIDHLKDEGNLENLLKNVSLKQNNYRNNQRLKGSGPF